MKIDYKKYFVVFGIAIGIVIISVLGINLLKKSQLNACVRNLNTLRLALEDYYNQNDFYPDKLNSENLTFLKPPLPKDTASGKPYIYEVSEDRKQYVLKCPDPAAHKVKGIIATYNKAAHILK